MAIRIAPVDDQTVPFELPLGKRFITVEIPHSDCCPPEKLREADEEAREKRIPASSPEGLRILLKILVDDEKAHEAIDQLRVRQLLEIDREWQEASGVSLGESAASDDSSTSKA